MINCSPRLLTFGQLSPTRPSSSATTPAVLTSHMALFPGSCEESSRRGKRRLTNRGGGQLFSSICGWGSEFVVPPCLRSNVPPSRLFMHRRADHPAVIGPRATLEDWVEKDEEEEEGAPAGYAPAEVVVCAVDRVVVLPHCGDDCAIYCLAGAGDPRRWIHWCIDLVRFTDLDACQDFQCRLGEKQKGECDK